MVTLQVVFMKTVKDLVVSKAAHLQVIVRKSAMQRAQYRFEQLTCSIHLLKYALQSFSLLGTVGQYVNVIAVGLELAQVLLEQIKVLVVERLWRGIEPYHCLRFAKGLCANIDALQVCHTAQKSLTCGEQRLLFEPCQLFRFLHLRCSLQFLLRLTCKALIVNAFDGIVHISQVLHHQHSIVGQIVGKWHKRLASMLLGVRHNAHFFLLVLRQLRLHFKGAYAVHLVAKEVNTEGIFRGV